MASHAMTREAKSGLPAIYLGMLFFLVSEAFLFGSLFWTYYFLRQNTAVWPPQGVKLALGLVSVNTVILLSSSGAMQWAVSAVRRGSRTGLIAGLASTFVLGTAFLGITISEWIHASFRPWSHAYGSIYFTLTGFHALHVFGGLLILGALAARASRGRFSQERYLAVEVGGLYWHFVDLVWVFVFTTLFIIR